MLSGQNSDYGKNGYFLASSGSVKWRDIYEAMSRALAKRGVVDSVDVKPADEEALRKMGEALQCPKDMVRLQLGGQ